MARHPVMKRPLTAVKQCGITLIETMGAMAIASTMMVGLVMLAENALEDMKGQQAALYQAQVADAARKYLAANYAQLVTGTANPATTLAVNLDALKTAGLLPASFAAINVYGQSICVLVKRNASLNPPAKLDALVVTYGGNAIEDKDIPAVALNAGAGGGYISTATPTTARGASWQLDTTAYRGTSCNGGQTVLAGGATDGGHLATALFYDGPGQLSSDFLYRDAVPGHPELNQMNTPLMMNNAALTTVGSPCGSGAGLAIDWATRAVLSCGSDGIWKNASASHWKAPVFDYPDLPASDNEVGDVRMVTRIGRSFTYDGFSWVAMGIDQDGNLTVPGSLQVHQDAWIGNYLAVTGHAQVGSLYGVEYVQGGYLRSNTFTQSGEINLFHLKNPGDPCHIPVIHNGIAVHVWPVGTILLDGYGVPLVCTSDFVFRYANGTSSP